MQLVHWVALVTQEAHVDAHLLHYCVIVFLKYPLSQFSMQVVPSKNGYSDMLSHDKQYEGLSGLQVLHLLSHF